MNRRIVYAQYNNPGAYPPIIHSARILADTGWQVLVLGIADDATSALKFPPHPRITVKQLPPFALGGRRVFYFLYFTLWVWYWVIRWRADWLYASDLYATPAARLVSGLGGARVVYHEHDAPDTSSQFAKWCLKARARLVRRGAAIVLPNAERAQRFGNDFGVTAKTHAVWNCPERAEVVTRDAPSNGQAFYLLYHGSLVPARLPLTIIEALTELPETVRLRIVGYETVGHVGYMREVFDRARGFGVAARVEWVGQVPTRTELLALARQCDVGFALMPLQSYDWNEQTMAGASNKPFDYMACGLGLIVSDLPAWRALYVANGFAQACDPSDAASVARAVRWYVEHSTERAAMGATSQAKIRDEWNYEMQFQPVLDVLNGVTKIRA